MARALRRFPVFPVFGGGEYQVQPIYAEDLAAQAVERFHEDFSSQDQIRDAATWIQELSKYTTLHPGDVLWMGTQGAAGDMFPGDTIEVEISGIGVLRNYLVAEE